MKKLIGVIILIIIAAVVAIGARNTSNKPKASEVKIETPAFEEEPKIEFESLIEEETVETTKPPLQKSDFQLDAIAFEDEPSLSMGEVY